MPLKLSTTLPPQATQWEVRNGPLRAVVSLNRDRRRIEDVMGHPNTAVEVGETFSVTVNEESPAEDHHQSANHLGLNLTFETYAAAAKWIDEHFADLADALAEWHKAAVHLDMVTAVAVDHAG